MRVVCAVALLAVLPACDRVFGLTDTIVVHGDDTGDDDAGSDAAECVGASCFAVVAAGQGGATEIVADPAGEHLAWNTHVTTSSASIVGCPVAGCVAQNIVTMADDHPHALLNDGEYVFWASNQQIHKAAIEGGAQGVVYGPTLGGAVTSFVFYGDCWIVTNGQILHGMYDGSLRTCGTVESASNVYKGTLVNNGDVTSQLSLLVDGDNNTFPLAGTTMGAYAYDLTSDIHDIYSAMTSAEQLASTKHWIAGIVPGQVAVRGVPITDSTAATVSVDLTNNAIAIKANGDGDIFVATDAGEIIRVGTDQMFGIPESVVSGIPDLRDFAFDHAGNIFAISGENIIRIDAR